MEYTIIEIPPNTCVCIRCKIRRHLFLFDRNDQVCNWCDLEEREKSYFKTNEDSTKNN